jgi:type VI secretion system protein ImpC
MLMSVNNEPQNYTGARQLKNAATEWRYASLFNKINLTPVAEIGDLNGLKTMP